MHNAVQETTQLHCPTVPDWTCREDWIIYIYISIHIITFPKSINWTHTHTLSGTFFNQKRYRKYTHTILFVFICCFHCFSSIYSRRCGTLNKFFKSQLSTSIFVDPSKWQRWYRHNNGLVNMYSIFCPGIRRFCLICIYLQTLTGQNFCLSWKIILFQLLAEMSALGRDFQFRRDFCSAAK